MIHFLGLPNMEDRLDILNFHLRRPSENHFLSSDISLNNLKRLAGATNGFSGADLAGIVRLAVATAMDRVDSVSYLCHSIILKMILVL
jgi:SpoVK/Ycf46/Vps4 family AAA+-type ATPase